MKRSDMDGHVMTRTDQALRLLDAVDGAAHDAWGNIDPAYMDRYSEATAALRALLTSGDDARDAERYRWLRTCTAEQEDMVMIRASSVERDELLSGAQLDAAIDRARLAGKEKADG